jgi:hypothetical protein
MDVLCLSYANPELAAGLILGYANLPCVCEDGSYNLVAEDGQVCGIAPEWGDARKIELP